MSRSLRLTVTNTQLSSLILLLSLHKISKYSLAISNKTFGRASIKYSNLNKDFKLHK